MFNIYVLPVMSAIKPRDRKTNQNSDNYMISGNTGGAEEKAEDINMHRCF